MHPIPDLAGSAGAFADNAKGKPYRGHLPEADGGRRTKGTTHKVHEDETGALYPLMGNAC